MDTLRRVKAAAEARAALATAEKAASERAAAEKLQDAHLQYEDLLQVSYHPCPFSSHAGHAALPEGSAEVRVTAVVASCCLIRRL